MFSGRSTQTTIDCPLAEIHDCPPHTKDRSTVGLKCPVSSSSPTSSILSSRALTDTSPVQSLEEWAERAPSRIQACSLSALKYAVIGVEASHYLDLRLNKTCPEPLLHALGGFPYSLKNIVEDDVQSLKKLDIDLVFVFNGLDFKNKEQASSNSLVNVKAIEDAWQHYLGGDALQTVEDFTRAST